MSKKQAPYISRLSGSEPNAKFRLPPSRAEVVNGTGEVDFRKLAAAVRRDRLRLRFSWPAYATHLGVPQSTIYKISRGASTPHELTVQKILDRWDEETAAATTN